jgi:hypothetical protein
MDERTLAVIAEAESVGKIFNVDPLTENPINEDDLQYIKNFLTGHGSLSDMDDSEKNNIRNATTENIVEVVEQAFKQTVYRSYRVRYGIIVNN